MTTVSDIIDRALRKITVIAHDDPATAEDAANALEALNGMLAEWKLRGVDISHADLALTDAFPLGNEYRDGVVYMLGARLSPDYSLPPFFDADDFFRVIQTAYYVPQEAEMDDAILRASAGPWSVYR